MLDNWKHLELEGYRISHEMKGENTSETISNIEGGTIPLTPKVKSYIDRLIENSNIESKIFFTNIQQSERKPTPQADSIFDDNRAEEQLNEDQTSENRDEMRIVPTREYIEKICLHEQHNEIKNIAGNLIQSLDKRINEGLLLILVSEDEEDIVSRRVILWYLPRNDGGFSLVDQVNKRSGEPEYSLDLIPELYVDSSKKFKSALFEGNIRGKITVSKVSDTSVSGSRYWIEDFLGASFELDSPAIQMKLANSIKKIANSPVETKEFNQRNEDGLVMVEDEWEPAFDFDSAINSIESLDDEAEITIDRFVEDFIPESKKASFNRAFPEEVRDVPFQAKSTKATFQEQFKRKKIRAILSDNSVIEIIGTREIIEKHLKRNKSNGKVTFTLEATDAIEDLMR